MRGGAEMCAAGEWWIGGLGFSEALWEQAAGRGGKPGAYVVIPAGLLDWAVLLWEASSFSGPGR